MFGGCGVVSGGLGSPPTNTHNQIQAVITASHVLSQYIKPYHESIADSLYLMCADSRNLFLDRPRHSRTLESAQGRGEPRLGYLG